MDNIPEMNDRGPDSAPEREPYVPRPAWQVWAARIGLVLFIGLMILYYCQLMGVGL